MTQKTRLKLGVLAIDGTMLSTLAAALDTLRVAQKLAEIRDPANAPRFETMLVSARGASRIASTNGLEVHGVVACPDDLDVLLVPGIMHDSPADLVALRPATGVPPAQLTSVTGRQILRSLRHGEPLTDRHFTAFSAPEAGCVA